MESNFEEEEDNYLEELNQESYVEELQIAKDQGDTELVEYLEEYRAAIDAEELSWNTSIYDYLAGRIDNENKLPETTAEQLEEFLKIMNEPENDLEEEFEIEIDEDDEEEG